jgi:predicted secreted protein with PEFG-CTERM motif
MSFFWLVVIGILISIGVFLSSDVSAQEQTNMTTNNVINVMNTNFSIQYNNTGVAKILSVRPDVPARALVITLQATKEGLLTVTLPRELIDRQDRGADSPYFFVISGGISGDAKENSETSTQRTITIPFLDETHEIVIEGTQIVPEFGSLAGMIIAISIIGVIAISTRFRFVQKV